MKSKIKPGMRFGALTIQERDYSKKNKSAYWLCKCDCGAVVSKAAQGLNNGETICCNNRTCPYKKFRGKNIAGQKFGRLTALKPTEKRINNSIVWIFQCDCGNIKEIPAYYVVNNGI